MKDYQASVCRYQPQLLASVDNDNLRLDNSSQLSQPHSIIVKYHAKTLKFSNCFIIAATIDFGTGLSST